MTSRDLVGQCLMVGFPGPELTSDVAGLLAEERIGGVCLFGRNLPGVAAARALCDALQRLAERELPAPMLIATDQEGGAVQRLTAGATALPSAMALGAAGPEAVRAVAAICGAELRAVGMNMALAPVLDVNVDPRNPVIGTRSYGGFPDQVAACGRAAIAGLQGAGVAATAKHFPGHGDSSVDSHLALPVLRHDLARLERVELVPFRVAAEAGVDAIMVGHLAAPAVDPSGQPATLSPVLNAGLLRDHLGYEGVVCTDCLEMAGLSSAVEGGPAFGALAVRAFQAGADLLLVSHRADRQRAAAAALREAVEAGQIPEARLRESAARVLALKRHLSKGAQPPPSIVGGAVHRAALTPLAAQAVTLVMGGRFPTEARPAVLVFQGGALNQAEAALAADPFAAAARARGLEVLTLPLDPGPAEREAALRLAERGAVVVGSRRLTAFPGQEEVTRELARRCPLALVALREPYDLAAVPEADTLVAAYGDQPALAEAALAAALGQLKPGGRLPVAIS